MKTSSVIIPTLDRPLDLKKMLNSIWIQTFLPDEVIIIDQSKTDESKIIAEKLFTDHNTGAVKKVILKYIRDPEISGAAGARNVGIEMSTNEIIFFFDDDVILEEKYIEETLKVYEKYPDIGGVGGVITNYAFLNRFSMKMFRKIFFLGLFKDIRQEIFINYKKYSTLISTNKISGGCVSYKKLILNTEKFDEKFDEMFGGYAFGEDIDLSIRISKKYSLFITPSAQLEHYSKTLNNERSKRKNNIFFESASWTYIFLKNSKNNFFLWLCYLWLYCGWMIRIFLSLIRFDIESIIYFYRGIHKGFILWSNENSKKNFKVQ